MSEDRLTYRGRGRGRGRERGRGRGRGNAFQPQGRDRVVHPLPPRPPPSQVGWVPLSQRGYAAQPLQTLPSGPWHPATQPAPGQGLQSQVLTGSTAQTTAANPEGQSNVMTTRLSPTAPSFVPEPKPPVIVSTSQWFEGEQQAKETEALDHKARIAAQKRRYEADAAARAGLQIGAVIAKLEGLALAQAAGAQLRAEKQGDSDFSEDSGVLNTNPSAVSPEPEQSGKKAKRKRPIQY